MTASVLHCEQAKAELVELDYINVCLWGHLGIHVHTHVSTVDNLYVEVHTHTYTRLSYSSNAICTLFRLHSSAVSSPVSSPVAIASSCLFANSKFTAGAAENLLAHCQDHTMSCLKADITGPCHQHAHELAPSVLLDVALPVQQTEVSCSSVSSQELLLIGAAHKST